MFTSWARRVPYMGTQIICRAFSVRHVSETRKFLAVCLPHIRYLPRTSFADQNARVRKTQLDQGEIIRATNGHVTLRSVGPYRWSMCVWGKHSCVVWPLNRSTLRLMHLFDTTYRCLLSTCVYVGIHPMTARTAACTENSTSRMLHQAGMHRR